MSGEYFNKTIFLKNIDFNKVNIYESFYLNTCHRHNFDLKFFGMYTFYLIQFVSANATYKLSLLIIKATLNTVINAKPFLKSSSVLF